MYRREPIRILQTDQRQLFVCFEGRTQIKDKFRSIPSLTRLIEEL